MSLGTYSKAPFISYDGPDSNDVRAEVQVVEGYGLVDAIESSDKGTASKITFKVENTKWPSSGWLPSDSPLMETINSAHESGDPIFFRIEKVRKPDVDRTASIVELTKGSDNARNNSFKSLAAVRADEESDWVISDKAKTRLDEDPKPSNGSSAYDYSLEELKKRGGSAPTPEGRAVDNFEAPPYKLYNFNGTLNLGSYAVGVPAGIYSYVSEYARTNELEIPEKLKRTLSRVILQAANTLQVNVYDGELEKPDLSAGSHTRARAILFEVIRSLHPITQEVYSSREPLVEWRNEILESGEKLWRWSIQETERVID